MKFPKQLMTAALAASLVALGGFPVTVNAADFVNEKFSSWERAADALGDGGVMYQPKYRAMLKQDGPIKVLAFGEQGKPARLYTQTSVTASFGNSTRNFIIDQKWANTGWAALPTVSPARRPVDTIKVALASGSELTVQIYANCNTHVEDSNMPVRTKCLKRDVLLYGGTLQLLTPASGNVTLRDRNNVVIRSKGLTYEQLVKVAAGLQQVS